MIGTGWDSLGQTGIAWVCSDKTSFHSLFLTAGRFHSFFTIHMLALRQQMLVSDPGSVVFFGHEVGPQAPRSASASLSLCDLEGAFPTAKTTGRNLVRSSVMFNQLVETSGTG